MTRLPHNIADDGLLLISIANDDEQNCNNAISGSKTTNSFLAT